MLRENDTVMNLVLLPVGLASRSAWTGSSPHGAQFVALLRAPVAVLHVLCVVATHASRFVPSVKSCLWRQAVDTPACGPVPKRFRVLVCNTLAMGDTRGREHSDLQQTAPMA